MRKIIGFNVLFLKSGLPECRHFANWKAARRFMRVVGSGYCSAVIGRG